MEFHLSAPGLAEKMFFSYKRILLSPQFSFTVYFIVDDFSKARGRPGKTVQMTEAEVRCLCIKSRELFLSQPILLELEAPLKICGE